MECRFKIHRLFLTLIVTAFSSYGDKPQASELLRKSIMAPSWEFRGVDHKWNWRQTFKKAESEALSVFIEEFEQPHAFAKNELITMFGEESLIESRLKPVESIEEELDEDGNKTVKDIYDVVTWRITFPTVQQLLQGKQRFIDDSRFTVAIVKCFGVCNKSGKYAATGYRGITLMAEAHGKPTEIQLVTPYMVMWADWAYSVLLKGSEPETQNVTKYKLQLADYYHQLDELRNKRPDCPKALHDKKVAKKSKMFETLGSPPSSCQFWNDLNVNKNKNLGERRKVLATLDDMANTGGKKTGNKPHVLDIDKILKPEDLKHTKVAKKSSIVYPIYYYY